MKSAPVFLFLIFLRVGVERAEQRGEGNGGKERKGGGGGGGQKRGEEKGKGREGKMCHQLSVNLQ